MILASASPRRAELLQAEGFQFETHPAWTDETRAPGEDPVSYVRRLARAKAWVVHNDNPQLAQGETLIAADTIVWTDDGLVLGKPKDADEARHMLYVLSGRKHLVTTGVCILIDGNPMAGCISETIFDETTSVSFFGLSDEEIEWYISTGEPFDKAGAYGIQGRGRRLVSGICGDFYNVVGLPIAHLIRELDRIHANIDNVSSYWF